MSVQSARTHGGFSTRGTSAKSTAALAAPELLRTRLRTSFSEYFWLPTDALCEAIASKTQRRGFGRSRCVRFRSGGDGGEYGVQSNGWFTSWRRLKAHRHLVPSGGPPAWRIRNG